MDRTLQLLASWQQHLPGRAETCAGCFRIAEINEKPPGWCLTCFHVTGFALKAGWGALSVTWHSEPAPYMLLHTCALLSHLYTHGWHPAAVAWRTGVLLKISGFSVQVQHCLLSFEAVTLEYKCVSVHIFSNRTFKDIFFLSSWGRYANAVFLSFTYVYFVLLCLPAEEAPDGEQDTDKLTKSPPPPPPRRSYLPGSGLTTTRSGDVIYTARKEAAAVKVWRFIL